MKYLIPIDFSKNAKNTISYALEMGNKNDEYIIFHAWDSLVTLTYPVAVSAGLSKEKIIDRNLDILINEVITNSPEYKSYDIQKKNGIGHPVFAIQNELESDDYDAVIMGTRDKYDLFDKFFGTVSLGIVKQAQIPVYLIPKDAKYKKIRKALVGTDHHFESEKTINKILDWNKGRRASLHFLHLTQPGKEFSSIKEKLFKELICERALPYSLSFEVVVSNEIAKTINHKADIYNHDLILIVPDKQSWLDALLRTSVSKELILNSQKPMLFLKGESDNFDSKPRSIESKAILL